MNDQRYPWLILVPDAPALRDWDDLDEGDVLPVQADVRQAARALRALFQPDKLNIAALGNVVEQLHIHVVARFTTDAAWPRPVWGALPPIPYAPPDAAARVQRLRSQLMEGPGSASATSAQHRTQRSA